MSNPDKNLDYDETISVSEVHASVRREKEDPQTGLEPATIGVFTICAILLMIGGAYLGAHGGFNSSSLLPGYTPESPGIVTNGGGEMTPALWLKKGKNQFGQCAGCHMLDGKGKAGQFPPLAGSEWVTGGTDRLAALILHGLTGPITVKGQTYSGAELMPAHKDKFTPEQVAQVMSYIRSAWGNEADTIVSTEMVEGAIKKYADRTGPFTASDLPPADADLEGALPEWAGGATTEPAGTETGGTGTAPPADEAAKPAPAE